MNQLILKEEIKEKIDGQKVYAVLMYSFNFDPIFFENYVMPLFIPDNDFSDIAIYNKILWRKYQKDDRIPPVTVYCDFYAKDRSVAPSLGYSINCIQVPEKKGYICNFHPKHIFILVHDKGSGANAGVKSQKLIVVTGSGNITPSGWCDNFEVFSIREFKANKSKPRSTTRNVLQDVIRSTAHLNHLPNNSLSGAEERIHTFLNYVDIKSDFVYHHSQKQSFKDFIKSEIPEDEQIQKIEIISPFFSADTYLLETLQDSFIHAEISILIPRLKTNEVTLKKETFELLHERGAVWSKWNNSDFNKEVRNLHAKIYRFHGKENVYTILGSVNFTNPAWGKCFTEGNQSNIETAVLYKEKITENQYLLKPVSEHELENLQFLPLESLENNDANPFVRYAPDIHFKLDWKKRTLSYELHSKEKGVRFQSILNDIPIVKGVHCKTLTDSDIKQLSANTLIELAVRTKEQDLVYTYYPEQLHVESKPFEFRLSVLHILDYWRLLGDELRSNQLSRMFAQQATDESGVVQEELVERKSILNEMASYFNALIKLENYLFNPGKLKDKLTWFRDLNYYLFTENIDTIPNCLVALEKDCQAGKPKSLYWMVLQIVIVNFYENASKLLPGPEHAAFRDDVQLVVKRLKKRSKQIANQIPGMEDVEVQNWVIKELKKNYD